MNNAALLVGQSVGGLISGSVGVIVNPGSVGKAKPFVAAKAGCERAKNTAITVKIRTKPLNNLSKVHIMPTGIQLVLRQFLGYL